MDEQLTPAEFAQLRRLKPAEAMQWMQERSHTALTFAWEDLLHEEHSRHFTISRLARLDLLQSLHGSYEFMMKTPRAAVQENRIDFQLTRSAAYDALLAALMEDLKQRYPRAQVESILMHEVVHWLRLMPYKLAKDRKRAPMFYAGLVMVANDVADFVQGEGKLC